MHGRFVRHRLSSEHLGKSREVTVRLPDDYDPQESYPVYYFQDGQNVFDSRTAFGGQEWMVDEQVLALEKSGRLAPSIVVAVNNGGASRLDEYTHTPDPAHGGGDGDKYEKFFLEELIPAVESTYGVDSSKRAVIGSSLGGLVSLTMALNHPGAFAAVGALSPSVWWSDGQLATRTLEGDSPDTTPRIWMDMGTEEGSSDNFGQRSIVDGKFGAPSDGPNGLQDVRDRTREMGEALLAKGWELDGDLRYHEPLGAGHNEASWRDRIGEVMTWLAQDS